jgi:NAD(P)H-hydrate epimerase
MENAGRGAVEVMTQVGFHSRVVICCGRGNNGGDGFVMARHLDNRGMQARVLLFADPNGLSGDAAENFAIIEKSELPIDVYKSPSAAEVDAALAGAACVVDALLGTGSHGEPRAPYDLVIDAINRRNVPVFAVDLPSGLDCDTGAAATHTVRAAHTITFVAAKPGLLVPGAAEFVGQPHVVDIGVPRRLIEEIVAESAAN